MSIEKISLWLFILPVIIILTFILLPAPDSSGYKISNLYYYYFYTDKAIKEAPKISENYSFIYIPANGSQGEMSTIIFHGGEAALLKDYLLSIGFRLYRIEDNGRNEIWLSEWQKNIIFSLWYDKNKSIIRLTKTTT